MGGAGDPILLYDGDCGFCAASVRLVLRNDPDGALRFAPLDSSRGRAIAGRHPHLQGIDSMVWVDRTGGVERVSTRSDAGLRMARYLGGWWRVAALTAIVPRPLRDAVYDFIARHRHRLAGSNQCLVPTPEERQRFLLS